MKKRVFAMLLAMAMVFSLMACGSKDKAGGSDPQQERRGKGGTPFADEKLCKVAQRVDHGERQRVGEPISRGALLLKKEKEEHAEAEIKQDFRRIAGDGVRYRAAEQRGIYQTKKKNARGAQHGERQRREIREREEQDLQEYHGNGEVKAPVLHGDRYLREQRDEPCAQEYGARAFGAVHGQSSFRMKRYVIFHHTILPPLVQNHFCALSRGGFAAKLYLHRRAAVVQYHNYNWRAFPNGQNWRCKGEKQHDDGESRGK